MIVAITGGTGFVGRKLVLKHLENGDTVKVLTRKKRELTRLPIETLLFNGDLLEASESMVSFVNNSDILYHCAAELKIPDLMYKTHVKGTENLLSISSGRIGRWVQLSSVGVYGIQRKGIVSEETSYNPSGTYELTKAKSDTLVVDSGQRGEINYSIVLPSNIYGSTMSNQYLFQLIKMIDRGLFFFIGKPGASANYIHVDNVIDAMVNCANNSKAINRSYIISEYMLLEAFVGIIAKKLNKKRPLLRLPAKLVQMTAFLSKIIPGFLLTQSRIDALTLRSSYSIKRIEDEFGYKPVKTMEEGLSEMVDAYMNFSIS